MMEALCCFLAGKDTGLCAELFRSEQGLGKLRMEEGQGFLQRLKPLLHGLVYVGAEAPTP